MDYQLIGNHQSIQKIRELIPLVSETAFTVLLLGETGTGKEVVARLLHSSSSRSSKRFVNINCAALPVTLLESELFGYERGAFTGADKMKLGKFELASGGVIFLDEIGDMPLIIQSKLLEVLQSGEFQRLGGTQTIKVNAWVVASTNHDLEKDMIDGSFRRDLFYRLKIIQIEMPPLRERKEDIPLLVDYFVKKYKKELTVDRVIRLDNGLLNKFETYHWPGNVRELSNIILRLVIGENPEEIAAQLFDNMVADGLVQSPVKTEKSLHAEENHGVVDEKSYKHPSLKAVKTRAAEEIEKKVILNTLSVTGWNKRKAAILLGISYKSLFNKMHTLGIRL